MTTIREGPCALCDVVMPFDNECVVVFIGPEACLPYHKWCWEDVAKRVVFVRPRVSDGMTVKDLVDLGLFQWADEEVQDEATSTPTGEE